MNKLETPLAALWWLSFWTAGGLCIGSFLNAVIFRIPRQKSLRDPIWSACPHCHYRLAWYDNLPLISFIRLGGRCRKCGVPIATRYMVIEAVMALVVLLLLDTFFIGGVRAGLKDGQFGLTDQLSYDWPILLAHVILFACLLAMSAIDLEHYWVDIRFTNFVTIAGFVLHTLWTPRHSMKWIRPGNATATASLAALLGLAIVWLIRMSQAPLHPADEAEVPQESLPEPPVVRKRPPPSLASPSRLAGWAATLFVMILFIVLALVEARGIPSRHFGRALLPIAFLFILTVSENLVPRASDHEIVEAIDGERHSARGMVLRELGLLLPAIVLGLLAGWLVVRDGGLSVKVGAVFHDEWHPGGLLLFRNWSPFYGFATAASGYIIAGAMGWAIRIVFTLLFGKEAFGLGDIHLMAAAGCVAGWPIVALGFFLTCGLALFAWLLSLPFKRTRAMPLGPWLSLGFLIVVIFYDPILRMPTVARTVTTARYIIGLEKIQNYPLD
ncbi:MAG: A24 family peptidase [Planctomycetes bacterium]|nr:A24 family peptidase [Planctomycetota bacterium]MBI3835201.1 A24 family peptidase [Planctomycetota bacterium]